MDQLQVSPTATRLYLCRHGETALNRLGKLQGARVDPPLDETGRDQARSLARELTGCGASIVASSTLQRAQQTAAAVAELLPVPPRVLAMPELNEIDFGEVADGMPADAAQARIEPVWRAWARGDVSARADGGESLRQVLRRFAKGAQRLLAEAGPGGRVVAVTHSGLLDVVLAAALAFVARGCGVAEEHWWTHAPETWNLLAARHMREDNACVNELVFSGPTLTALVDVPRVAYRRFWVWDHGAGANK